MLPLYDMHEMNMQWGWQHLKILFILHSQQTVSFIKIIAVCSDIHTKYINTMCGHDV